MRFLSCAEVSAQTNITVRRIQQMCKTGRVSGAIKHGRSWVIPESSVSNLIGKDHKKKKPLPVGVADFKTATSEYYYVDKTLLIRDFLDNRPMVSLFTRPRRFGKTLNMDMLRVFFEKTDRDTSVYFQDKLIWQCGKEYTSYQGKYPVIFLSFKDVKHSSWNETRKNICKLISMEFNRHSELENSSKLSSYEKLQYLAFTNQNADEITYQMFVQKERKELQRHLVSDLVCVLVRERKIL